ncbi:diphthine synthase [Halomarina oriensis]|uniref:Diphthine synthase n=1 Tax=Halomarina oriensis TaxID=671145 RepID=A0A6B0GL39_9EURY|nr:diphthine synthase [Halomarina oriensis]MWG33513.1 diphthine synthase [Halomarina oriensis]
MLTFVGLGLWDERSVTLEGRETLAAADRVFAEFYTSRLMGSSLDQLETFHDCDVEVRDRAGVEQNPDPILDAAEDVDVVFFTAGDTMISTTHVDLRMRAEARGIETRVVHGTTAEAAASSLTGLQNYRFGKATTLPFPFVHSRESRRGSRASQNATRSDDGGDGVPDSVLDTIAANRERGLHTLVFLDIKVRGSSTDRRNAELATDEREHEEFMSADYAADLLSGALPETLAVAVCRAGSPDPLVAADRLDTLADRAFGGPLHLLVIPGDLHLLEADALRELADAPAALVEESTV